MKLLLGVLLCAISISGFNQGKTLYRVNLLKPKAGMRSAFEESWKTHVNKFHNSSDKRTVFELTSGPDNGAFLVVEGPISYADMDEAIPTAKEHALDIEKNFSTLLEPGSVNGLYRWVDTLSYHGGVKADKFLVSITTLQNGKTDEYMTELRRNALLYAKLNLPLSITTLVKQQAGSSPVVVTKRSLKDGFKELDADYYKMAPNQFKDEYIKEYGQDAWDKRIKLLVDDVVKREQHFEKLRADLSSK